MVRAYGGSMECKMWRRSGTNVICNILRSPRKSSNKRTFVIIYFCGGLGPKHIKRNHINAQTTGVVYQARDRQTGDIVALKRCLPHHEASDGFPLTTLREITVLRELQSAGGRRHGIIGLKDVTVSSRYDYVVNLYFISLVGMSVLCVLS